MSTFTCLRYHIVFSTKNRVPSIRPEWQERLWQFMAGTVTNLKGRTYQIGGIADHVHCLVSVHQTMSISNFVRDLKANASGWIHSEFGDKDFWWQEGYAAFTVSQSLAEIVQRYILNQDEHHRTMTFQQEYLALLQRHEIEYNEKYLWS